MVEDGRLARPAPAKLLSTNLLLELKGNGLAFRP